MRQDKSAEQGEGGKMQEMELELEQVHGAETRNVPSMSHMGAAGLAMDTEVLRHGHGKGDAEGQEPSLSAARQPQEIPAFYKDMQRQDKGCSF